MRLAITGGPNTGKTTLANQLSSSPLSTDSLMHLPWQESSAQVSSWFDSPEEDFVYEGILIPYALRKWLRKNEKGKPLDKLIFLTLAHTYTNVRQNSLNLALTSVFNIISNDLLDRKVEIEIR